MATLTTLRIPSATCVQLDMQGEPFADKPAQLKVGTSRYCLFNLALKITVKFSENS
jgi:hypothetical protein